MKRALIFALVLSLLLPSCGVTSGGEQDLSTTVSEAETTQVPETEDLLAENLPDVNFDGRAFRIGGGVLYDYEIQAEEETGEAENDAIYDREIRLEERFNINIEPIIFPSIYSADNYQALVQSELAHDNTCEIAGFEVWNLSIATTNGIYQNWLDTPYFQPEKAWWNQEINEKATINGKLLGATGSLGVTFLQMTSAVFCNVDLLEEASIDLAELYSVVHEGGWTIDYFDQLITNLYQDVNGNGQRDLEDVYGYAAAYWVALDVWPTAFDIDITGKDDDGRITLEFYSEKAHTALERVYKLFYQNPGGYKVEPFDLNNDYLFVENKMVFFQSYLQKAFREFREMEAPYGILPVPKYDEQQNDYHNLVIDGYSIWGLPVSVSDTEYVSLITEAMCADTHKNVYPIFFDVAMKSKYSQDEVTTEMVDLIMESASFDIGFMYGTYMKNLPYMFRSCIQNKTTDLASAYKSKEASILEQLDKIYELYE